MKANNIKNANLIFAGKTLKIPVESEEAFNITGLTVESEQTTDNVGAKTLAETSETSKAEEASADEDTSAIDKVINARKAKTDEVDAKQQAAREKFDKLQASNGMTYEKARDIVEKTIKAFPKSVYPPLSYYVENGLEEEYVVDQDDPLNFENGTVINTSAFLSNGAFLMNDMLPMKGLELIEEFKKAFNAMLEIENNNPALFSETGYTPISNARLE